tara:strand:+ start:1945 stop:2133 length:189 start_codon:yes stop_codon:yes gene_type:complete
MKKTKTGLHIETRKNRIEVYTKKDLQQREKELSDKRELIITASLIALASLLITLGFIVGLSV